MELRILLLKRKKKKGGKLQTLVSSFIKNKKKDLPISFKRLGIEEVKRKYQRAFQIIRVIHRLQRISEDIQLYGTSSNLFDLTTRDRDRVKKILYPSVFDETADQLKEENNLEWYILHPKSKTRLTWSAIMVLLLTYTATIMPYRLTFEDNVAPAWQIVDLFVDVLFILDLMMNFISAYYDDDGKLIKEPRALAHKYLKSWFLLDVIAVFPFEVAQNLIIDHDLVSSSPFKYNLFLRLIRLSRLYRLVKILRINDVFNFLRGTKAAEWLELNSIFLKLLFFSIVVVILVHIMACIWYLVARLDDNNPDTWTTRTGLEHEDNGVIYLASLYYIFTILATVGYGDIYGSTVPEKILSIIGMILGVGFYSFTVGIIASIFASRENRASSLKRKISIANEFAKEIKAPKSLKIRIRKILEYNSLRNCFSWANKKSVFSEIPVTLRYEIVMAMHNGILSTIPFFREHSDKYFVVTIAELLKPIQVNTKDYLWREGDSAEAMYFLVSGKVHLISSEFVTPEDRVKNQKTSIIFKRFVSGSYFGEVELIFKKKRSFTLQASAESELFYVTKHDYFNILIPEFPHIHEEFKEVALARDKHNSASLMEIRTFLHAHIPEDKSASGTILKSRSNSALSNAKLNRLSSEKITPLAQLSPEAPPKLFEFASEESKLVSETSPDFKDYKNYFVPEIKLNNLNSSPEKGSDMFSQQLGSNSIFSPSIPRNPFSQLEKPFIQSKYKRWTEIQGNLGMSSDPMQSPSRKSGSSLSSTSSDTSEDEESKVERSSYRRSTYNFPVKTPSSRERRKSASNSSSSQQFSDNFSFASPTKYHKSQSFLTTPILRGDKLAKGALRLTSALKPGAVITTETPMWKGRRKKSREISYLKMAIGMETEEDSSPNSKQSSSPDKKELSIRKKNGKDKEKEKVESINKVMKIQIEEKMKINNLKNDIQNNVERMRGLETKLENVMENLRNLSEL